MAAAAQKLPALAVGLPPLPPLEARRPLVDPQRSTACAGAQNCSKDCRPSAGALDSQGVKSSAHGDAVGYDVGKKIKGRKRYLLMDTLGMVLAAKVTPATTPERQGSLAVFDTIPGWLRWFKKLWVVTLSPGSCETAASFATTSPHTQAPRPSSASP